MISPTSTAAIASRRVYPTVAETIAIARREVERHKKQFIALTASAPYFEDQNGLLEWMCDIRIGNPEDPLNSEVVTQVIIAMQQPGIINDINIPVVVERSVDGRLSVIARAQVRLPNIRAVTYTYYELDFTFMTNLTQDGTGWFDGFGHQMASPETTGTTINYSWDSEMKSLEDMDIDNDRYDASTYGWTQESG